VALSLTVSSAGAEVNREAITSYNRMQPGAPDHGYFENVWQNFTAQSSIITHLGVTVGNPALPAGISVPYDVTIRLCTDQPDAEGHCNYLAQTTPQIINYGNTYADIGDVAVTKGQTYWVVWYQPPAVSGTSWVTYWWAGGPTITTSEQEQAIVTGYDPPPPPTANGWLGPEEGSTLNGTVSLQAHVDVAEEVEFDAYYATNSSDITTVGWHDIGLGANDGSGNWSLAWNSTSIPNQGNAGWGTVNIVAIPITGGQLSETRYYRRFNIDNSTPSAPVPTPQPPAEQQPLPLRYAIANVTSVNLRQGPTTSSAIVGSLPGNTTIEIVCQTVGSNVNGSTIWDQLTGGAYVSDWYTTTPVVGDYSPGIPQCSGAPPDVHPPAASGRWSIVATSPVNLRSGAGTGFPVKGSLGPGASFDIACQTYGTIVFGSPVWDRLPDGRYVADYFTNTPVYANFSPGLATCAGTSARPTGSSGSAGSQPSTPSGETGGSVGSGPLTDCSRDIVIIGARGSEEGATGFGTTVWKTVGVVSNHFPKRVRLDSLDYEYPAMPILSVYTLFHFYEFLTSVSDGTQALLSHVQNDIAAWHCRNQLHFVLVGYSQGAWAVGDAVLAMSAPTLTHVSGVVLLGDPRNHGSVLDHGVWDNGHVFPADIQSRIKSYCHSGDPVCDATPFDGLQVLLVKQHTSYKNPGDDAEQGGQFLVNELTNGR
jgi:uncharacterized protein YraI